MDKLIFTKIHFKIRHIFPLQFQYCQYSATSIGMAHRMCGSEEFSLKFVGKMRLYVFSSSHLC